MNEKNEKDENYFIYACNLAIKNLDKFKDKFSLHDYIELKRRLILDYNLLSEDSKKKEKVIDAYTTLSKKIDKELNKLSWINLLIIIIIIIILILIVYYIIKNRRKIEIMIF
jgi:hypothetical protein